MDTILTLSIIGLALAVLLRKAVALLRGKSTGCGHCAGASSCQVAQRGAENGCGGPVPAWPESRPQGRSH